MKNRPEIFLKNNKQPGRHTNQKKQSFFCNKNPTTTLWQDDASLASKLPPRTYKFRSTLRRPIMQNGARRGPLRRVALPTQSISPLIKLGILFTTLLYDIKRQYTRALFNFEFFFVFRLSVRRLKNWLYYLFIW